MPSDGRPRLFRILVFLNGIIAGINGMKTSSRQSVYMAGNLFTTVDNIPKAYRNYLEG